MGQAANCASLRLSSVEWVNDLALSYDTAEDEPDAGGSAYEVKSCGRVNDITATFSGDGSLLIQSCPVVGDLVVGGDQTLTVGHSGVGAVTLSSTIAATLSNSPRGTASVAAGAPTLEETRIIGTQAFVASASEDVTFDVTQPDTSYQVLLDSPDTSVTLAVTAKTTTTFTIAASGALTGTVGYVVYRDV